MNELLKTINVSSLVRSAVVLVLGAPLLMGVGTAISSNVAQETKGDRVANDMRSKLMEPCIDFAFSKPDSKLEREAKTDIDDVFGGQVNYQQVCNWVTN